MDTDDDESVLEWLETLLPLVQKFNETAAGMMLSGSNPTDTWVSGMIMAAIHARLVGMSIDDFEAKARALFELSENYEVATKLGTEGVN